MFSSSLTDVSRRAVTETAFDRPTVRRRMNALAAAGHTRGRVSLANDSFSLASPRRVPPRLARTRVRTSSREASKRTRASPSPARPRVHARSDVLPEATATQTTARRRRRLGDPHRSIQSWHTCTRKRERTVRVRSMTIKNKGPDRTNGKKQSARDRRRARARRDETNVCEFVRSSDARGRRPGGRTAGRARRPRWTWASAMRVVRLDRGREG